MKIMPIILVLLCFSLSGISQDHTPVDYEGLYETLQNEDFAKEYELLLERYRNADLALTLDDYRFLYYGFTFTEAYRPYDRNELDEKISDLLAEGINDDTRSQLIDSAIDYLDNQPFSLKMISYLKNFYQTAEGYDEEIEELKTQSQGIIEAILSSGDGLTKETGFSVNHSTDEYMVMRSLGVTPKNNHFETTFDRFILEENKLGYSDLYFDVYQMAKVGTMHLGVVTQEVQNDTLPEDGVLIGSDEEFLSFIPLGYNVLYKLQADLNFDEQPDWLLVLAKQGEQLLSNAAANDPEPRILLTLFRNNEGLLEKEFMNDQAIPCIDCGESDEDPFQSIKFADGTLTIKTMGGELFKWERESKFEFTEQGYVLMSETFTSYRRGKKDDANVDVEQADTENPVYLKVFNFYDLMN